MPKRVSDVFYRIREVIPEINRLALLMQKLRGEARLVPAGDLKAAGRQMLNMLRAIRQQNLSK